MPELVSEAVLHGYFSAKYLLQPGQRSVFTEPPSRHRKGSILAGCCSNHGSRPKPHAAVYLHKVKAAGDQDHAFNYFMDPLTHTRFCSICRLKESQVVRQTGMVMVEAGMLSGFRLSPGALAPEGLVQNVEAQEEKVTLYLNSVRLR